MTSAVVVVVTSEGDGGAVVVVIWSVSTVLVTGVWADPAWLARQAVSMTPVINPKRDLVLVIG